jgi:hypothetical protein
MGIPASLSSVPAATPYVQYIATSGQTVFPYPFPITQDSDLVVVINGVTQNTDSGYTLSGVGNPTGGNVTFTTGQTTGAIITFYRDIVIERITQITQNSGFSSTAFNAEFNNIYLIMQQLQESLSFALQVPNTNNPAPVTMLTPANYASKYLAFDSYGNPTPAVLTSSGSLTQANVVSLLETPFSGGATDVGSIYLTRNASYAGGTVGFVNSTMFLVDNVGASATAFEWTITGVMNNSATGGQNVAGYFQGNRITSGTGPTWAAVCEAREEVAIANPTSGLVSLEIDNRSNGTDSSLNRIGIHIVASRYNASGAATTLGAGILIDNNSDGSNTAITNGMVFGNKTGSACTFATGINMVNGTYTSAAIWLPQGAAVAFDAPGANQLANNGSGLDYSVSGTLQVRLMRTGGLQIQTTQVVGVQQTTGVASATFVQNSTNAVYQNSTFDGYTLPQVVKALRLHGLLA